MAIRRPDPAGRTSPAMTRAVIQRIRPPCISFHASTSCHLIRHQGAVRSILAGLLGGSVNLPTTAFQVAGERTFRPITHMAGATPERPAQCWPPPCSLLGLLERTRSPGHVSRKGKRSPIAVALDPRCRRPRRAKGLAMDSPPLGTRFPDRWPKVGAPAFRSSSCRNATSFGIRMSMRWRA